MDIQYKPGCANVITDALSWVVPADETVPSVSLSTYLAGEQDSLLAPLIAHFGEDMVGEVLDAALHALTNGLPLV